jgi:DNA (cytosine-5)-methyltransferase 1
MVFGEQVASKDGREWLAAVRVDLEAAGYAVGAANLCAAGVGAPHIRQRLWFVADHDQRGRQIERPSRLHDRGASGHDTIGCGEVGGWSDCVFIPCLDGKARPIEPSIQPLAHGVPARVGRLRAYGNAIVPQVAAAFIEAVMSAHVASC